MMKMTQKPYLNLGCGRIILPAERPAHHGLIDEAIYSYPLWVNADRNAEPGVDIIVDAFVYPWPWPDNSFDGALLTHICEHIPHEIRLSFDDRVPRWLADMVTAARTDKHTSPSLIENNNRALRRRLANMQDGWYAFMSELHRVLAPGAIAHIVSPYGWSQGAITDPTHTRLITEHTWTHSLQPDPNSPFKYETGGLNLELVEAPRFNVTKPFAHLLEHQELFQQALMTQINVVYDLAVKLRVIK